ncbi:transposase [Streptomyces sp. NPDC012403]|uniref:transposase n=1 Tax=Streptomyces sp. NPDC012403 TaxID=3364831 RepID=UPI0036EA43BF
MRASAPSLPERFGIGPDSAAALLIAAGDNPERLNNEASFAALCGASPVGPSTLIADTSTLDLESRERSPEWGPTSTRRSSGRTRPDCPFSSVSPRQASTTARPRHPWCSLT